MLFHSMFQLMPCMHSHYIFVIFWLACYHTLLWNFLGLSCSIDYHLWLFTLFMFLLWRWRCGSHYVPWYPKVEVRCPEKRHERRAAMKGFLWAQKQKYGPKYGGNHISAIVVSKVVFSIPHWWSGFFPSSKASSVVIYIGTWFEEKNKASWSPAKSSEMVGRHA